MYLKKNLNYTFELSINMPNTFGLGFGVKHFYSGGSVMLRPYFFPKDPKNFDAWH